MKYLHTYLTFLLVSAILVYVAAICCYIVEKRDSADYLMIVSGTISVSIFITLLGIVVLG